MTNPKGTQAETALVNWSKLNGFPHAVRIAKSGSKDKGDVRLSPLGGPRQIIVEVKNYLNASTGQPGAKQLAKWMAEVEAETFNAQADLGFAVVKRKGTTDVGKWWVYLTLADFCGLVGGVPTANQAPICLQVEVMASLILELWPDVSGLS